MKDKYILDGSSLTCTKCPTIEHIKSTSKTVKIQGRYACNETDKEFTNFQFPSCDSLRTCVPQLVKWNHTPSNTVKVNGSKLLRSSSTMDCGAGGQVSFVADNQTFITAPPSFLTKLSKIASGFIYLGPHSTEGCGSNNSWWVPDILFNVDARVPCYWHDVAWTPIEGEKTVPLTKMIKASVWLGINIVKDNPDKPFSYVMGFSYFAATTVVAICGSAVDVANSAIDNVSKAFSIDLDSLRKAEQERMQDYIDRGMIPPQELPIPTEPPPITSQPTPISTPTPFPVAGPTPDVSPASNPGQNIQQTNDINENYGYEQPVDVPPF